MTRIRKNVRSTNDLWPDDLLWYAKAVGRMRARPISDPTSWRFLAAMHGFDRGAWVEHGMLDPLEVMPTGRTQRLYWDQCQHATWYFLPWHRGYISAFEAIVREDIRALGGPADTWALPYWNYNLADSQATYIPRAFLERELTDGGQNPLWVERWGGDGAGGGQVVDPAEAELVTALQEQAFTGLVSQSGGVAGFGGPETDFIQYGPAGGALEQSPHNLVHTQIGGGRERPDGTIQDGIMSDPETAAFDPIFWLHHCNIDRLWEVWLNREGGHQNSDDARWLTGPLARPFLMPRPDGSAFTFTAAEMLDTRAALLDYEYDDISDPLQGASRLKMRVTRNFAKLNIEGTGLAQIPPAAAAELLGANDQQLRLSDGETRTSVRLVRGGIHQVRQGFVRLSRAAGATEPDRVFLNIEGLRSRRDSVILRIYINLPAVTQPNDLQNHYAGSISLFGVRKASRVDGTHGGNGVTRVLEITDLIDRLALSEDALESLEVQFLARNAMRPQDDITVDRVSVYRQGV